MQITSKAETYIGFSIKSGKIVWGLDNVIISRKPIKLILICSSLGENSEKKLLTYASGKAIKVLKLTDRLLEDVVNKTNCKVIGLTDAHLAQAVISNSENWATDCSKGGLNG